MNGVFHVLFLSVRAYGLHENLMDVFFISKQDEILLTISIIY